MSHNKKHPADVQVCMRPFDSLDRVRFILPPLLLVIWEALPAKRKTPVKVAPVVILAVRGRFHELKGIEVNSGNIRTHYCSVVFSNPRQQRLQPPVKAFTCEHIHTQQGTASQLLPHKKQNLN